MVHPATFCAPGGATAAVWPEIYGDIIRRRKRRRRKKRRRRRRRKANK